MPEGSLPPPEECANCGAEIPRDARACPECGADERTGWRDPSVYDGLDLPSEAFEDHADAPRRTAPPFGLPWYFLFAGFLLLALLTLGLVVFR
jgi:hypothetical protein